MVEDSLARSDTYLAGHRPASITAAGTYAYPRARLDANAHAFASARVTAADGAAGIVPPADPCPCGRLYSCYYDNDNGYYCVVVACHFTCGPLLLRAPFP